MVIDGAGAPTQSLAMIIWSYDVLTVLLLALALDALIGEPKWLWSRTAHPVVVVGKVIAWADRRLNRDTAPAPERRLTGTVFIVGLLASAALLGWLIVWVLQRTDFALIGEVIIASTLLAGRSLYDHVRAVADGLAHGGLAAGREAVSRIVGRDPDKLDQAGVVRSAIESLAENFSDGVVAPAFWFALFGLPGICAYKALNTADSMIGHMSDRHRDFGWAAARLDDLANWFPARLAGRMIVLAALVLPGMSGSNAVRVKKADAARHRSPNAGHPEAAMAGALGIALAGPRIYATGAAEDDFMGGDGRHAAIESDIRAGLRLYVVANAMLVALIAALAWLI